mgnify:CR=1 FL=1
MESSIEDVIFKNIDYNIFHFIFYYHLIGLVKVSMSFESRMIIHTASAVKL